MRPINVSVTVEVSVDLCLNKQESEELLSFLKQACAAPSAPSRNPPTGIVRRLAEALERNL